MIKKRLLTIVPESKKFIAGNVVCQWISLAANAVMMLAIAMLLAALFEHTLDSGKIISSAICIAAAVAVRLICTLTGSKMSYLSSKTVKKKLRAMIYEKLLRLGASYNEKVSTAEVVQVSVEGVDQLETYFGAYLPQFFYAMLAPLTLFGILCFVNVPSAVVLLVCVPLIPGTIMMIQKWAKKLLAKYWGEYTKLGDHFLENVQGLTTLKIYQTDGMKNDEMNVQAERFRKITMKVLTMQLNSVTIMDFIAAGGAALGIIMGVWQLSLGNVDLKGCLLIILLSADFFIPMRRLGSYFHIAMNGMAASDKIFKLLDLPDEEAGGKPFPAKADVSIQKLSFSYDGENNVIREMTLTIPYGGFIAVVGESGCGKSTMANILMGRNKHYNGSVKCGGIELSEIDESELMQSITYIGSNSYLFKGTVRDNLLLGKPDAVDEEMWEVLGKTKLDGFFRSENGLDTELSERAANLSGGQRQRIALARALLHNSELYIFDEATSNIDVESENEIVAQIHALAKDKTVIMISHRLANVVGADSIFVLEKGALAEQGSHSELLKKGGVYTRLWQAQQELEAYAKEAV